VSPSTRDTTKGADRVCRTFPLNLTSRGNRPVRRANPTHGSSGARSESPPTPQAKVARGWHPSLGSQLSFTLAPTASGARLSLVQSGSKPDQKQNCGSARYGWKMMGEKLVDLLARSRDRPIRGEPRSRHERGLTPCNENGQSSATTPSTGSSGRSGRAFSEQIHRRTNVFTGSRHERGSPRAMKMARAQRRLRAQGVPGDQGEHFLSSSGGQETSCL
jgi:hypothetical protein